MGLSIYDFMEIEHPILIRTHFKSEMHPLANGKLQQQLKIWQLQHFVFFEKIYYSIGLNCKFFDK